MALNKLTKVDIKQRNQTIFFHSTFLILFFLIFGSIFFFIFFFFFFFLSNYSSSFILLSFLFSSTSFWPSRLGQQNTLCKRVKLPQRISWTYDTKQSDSKLSIMPELWGMRSIPLLPSLPDPLWPEGIILNRVLSMGQIELNCVFMLKWIAWNKTVLTFNCE